ncbi:MAG TPA: phosphatase PAP2 family protein [Gaiellales bacterium]|jgi:undecaprenyl-diphosphatase|nr:phosphatase PAP2 family protein [Gaiellales bacterium]
MPADARLAGHPVLAFLAVTVVGFVVLAAVTILVGWLLKTYALPEHGFGHADEHVNVWLARHRSGTRNDLSLWLSGMGDVYAIPALVAVSAIVAAAMRLWRVAAFIVTAIAVEAATYRVVTSVIHRQRPQVPRLDHLPVDASYYSGHTAASVAVYGGLALLITSSVRSRWARAACWAIAVVIPLLVAVSRMYRGMHHPTDVAAGALVGIGTLGVALAAARTADAANARRRVER